MGLTVNISTTLGDPDAICNNITVSGSLNIPGTKTITINGSLFGSGAIATTNNIGVFGTIRLRGDNNHTGTFTPNSSGYFYYEGADQIVRVTNYANLIMAGSGNKTMPSGAAFTVSSGLTVNTLTTFYLGAGSTKSMYVAGSAIIDGTLVNGSTSGNKIQIHGNLSGLGRFNMIYSATSELQLYGASNALGSVSSLFAANHTISYLREGNQTIFGSDGYPKLTINQAIGLSTKTISAPITCTSLSMANANVDLANGTTTTGSNWSIWSKGNTTIVSGEIRFGTTAKRCYLQGAVSGAGSLVLTGTGIAHYLRLGSNANTIANTQLLLTANGGSSTVEYSGPSTQRILDIDYSNLTTTEIGVKSFSGIGVRRVYGTLLVGANSTFDAGDLGTLNLAVVSILGTYQDYNGVLADESYFVNGTLTVENTGKLIGNTQSRFWFANNVINKGLISITGAGSYDQMSGGTRQFDNLGTVIFDREVQIGSNFTLKGNPFLFNHNVSLTGASSIFTVSTTGVTTVVGQIGGINSFNGFVLSPYAHVKYLNAQIPLSNGLLNVSATGAIFEYGSSSSQVLNAITYHHLLLSGSASKSAQTGFRTLGNLSITGTNTNFSFGLLDPDALDIAGNLHIGNGSRLTFNSSGAPHSVKITGNLEGNTINSNISFSGIGAHTLYCHGSSNTLKTMEGTTVNTVASVYFVSNGITQSIPNLSYPNLVLSNTGVSGIKRPSTSGALRAYGDVYLYNTVFDLGNFVFILNSKFSTISGNDFTASNMFNTSGSGYITRYFESITASDDFIFPLGSGGVYAPARVRITSAIPANASYNISSISTKAANLTDPSHAIVRHWPVQSFNFTTITATVTGTYAQSDVLTDSESSMASGWYPNSVPWQFNISNLNAATNQVWTTFVAATNMNGVLTAAQPGNFNSGVTITGISSSALCQNQFATLTGISSGSAFVGGNNFTIQVSTINGFTSGGINLNSVGSTTYPSNFVVSIPSSLPPGRYYVRVSASNPKYFSQQASFVVTVNSAPVNTSTPVSVCRDDLSAVNLTGIGGTSWVVEPLGFGTLTGNVFTPSLFIGSGSIIVTSYFLGGGCTSTGTNITLNATPTNTTSSTDICFGSTKSLVGGGSSWVFVSSPTSNFGSIAGTTYSTGATAVAQVITITTYGILTGCTSPGIAFQVFPNTTITSQPLSQSLGVGTNGTYSVDARGRNLTFQWQKGTPFANLANGGSISGANTSILQITNAPLAASGSQYRVIVSGSCGSSITSSGANLTVVNVSAALFRSNTATGNWNANSSWQRWDGFFWVGQLPIYQASLYKTTMCTSSPVTPSPSTLPSTKYWGTRLSPAPSPMPM